MCNDCFNSEIQQFPDAESWNSFQLALLRKIYEGKMKAATPADGSEGIHIHQCLSCGENWVLQAFVNRKSGSFMTLSTVLKKLAVPAWRRRLSIVVLVLVIILVVLEFLAS